MLLPLEIKELNHLFYLSGHATERARENSAQMSAKASDRAVQERLSALLKIQETKRSAIPLDWLSEATPFFCGDGETGVYLAKNYKENGVMVGDRGYLSYTSHTGSAVQEQRLPIAVAGFYDPGILSVGNRCIFAPAFVPELLNKSSSSFHLDKRESNGILVWMEDIDWVKQLKAELERRFQELGIAAMWKVSTFHDYTFAKDLLVQFQSDKYLFSLITAIILLVACCNIISLLTLLVNDKKKEIGILQAMGASSGSIATIFGLCGAALGIVSCLIGAACAAWTIKHIDQIVTLLSLLQGREAFNAAFFGASLPNELSASALRFIFCLTPLLSLLAGLVPAIKACRLKPAEILRSQ